MAVMTNPLERKARTELKKRLILRFLRSEIWSTPDVLSDLIQTNDPRTINRTLDRLEKDGLIVREIVHNEMQKWRMVGITMSGQIEAWAMTEVGEVNEKIYERGRVGLSLANHTLDLQRLRIRTLRAGWRGWVNADRMSPEQRSNLEIKSKSYKRPDAIVSNEKLGKVAVECERHVKSGKRYRAILESHLASMKQRKFDAVVWACPTPELARGLDSILRRHTVVTVAGQRVRIDDGLRKRLIVTDYNNIENI